jgi:hypothetical protein
MSSTKQRFAVIVPYREREYNLAHLILHLQWYLDPDSFDMFVVEQADSLPFNRGCTMNIGFQLARAADRYSHYVFHDVDLIPLEADFSFSRRPAHLSAEVSQFLYELPYQDCFGGVVLFNREDFETVNGYSNHYWGWGVEDNDLRRRCLKAGLKAARRPGRFLSLPHFVESGRRALWARNAERFNILQEQDFREDGVSSLKYELVRSAELTHVPFTERKKQLARPVQWASVLLSCSDILPDEIAAANVGAQSGAEAL